ncbi:hypothetical protein K503DRAFT_132309 [Rhizopogon vinicolor AM-OR11-026]|uniref:Uncharacterized protein n=1 Tax=Rhizopogon vinicolor AM-OR11-026 TaxID=1314800 RepID=A0A1B7N1U3_9AGAM|nr:hypothetical protein K503DRAFT_132309 [Rhizopogon vinicolor AM-OR11-026]
MYSRFQVLKAYHLLLPREEFMAFLTRSDCPLEYLIFSAGVMMTYEEYDFGNDVIMTGDRVTMENTLEYVTLIPSLEVINGPRPSWLLICII